jgi:hypothetical protein
MAAATHTTLSKFKAALSSGGARPSLFDVSVSIPSGFGTASEITSTCSVSAIPPLTVTPIERQYFGRTVKIPGDMVFGDLTTTFINTEDYSVRTALESWTNKINSTASNIGISSNGTTGGFGSLTLSQYDKTGKSLLSWTFVDCWPQTIAEIAMSYDTASDIETFDITWAYNYYTQAKGSASTVTSNAVHI